MTVIQVAQMIVHRDQNQKTRTQEIEHVKNIPLLLHFKQKV